MFIVRYTGTTSDLSVHPHDEMLVQRGGIALKLKLCCECLHRAANRFLVSGDTI